MRNARANASASRPLHFDCHAIASTLKIVAHYPYNARLIFDDKDLLHLKPLMFLKLA